jgi:hypothetical protein
MERRTPVLPPASLGEALRARPALRSTQLEDEEDDEDGDSTELAEVLPDEACGLQASSSDG